MEAGFAMKTDLRGGWNGHQAQQTAYAKKGFIDGDLPIEFATSAL